jgi:hypothetical protein
MNDLPDIDDREPLESKDDFWPQKFRWDDGNNHVVPPGPRRGYVQDVVLTPLNGRTEIGMGAYRAEGKTPGGELLHVFFDIRASDNGHCDHNYVTAIQQAY